MARTLKPSTVLTKARALIEDPKHWTQGALARARNGHVVEPTDPRAWRFCALGAIDHIGNPFQGVEKSAESYLYEAVKGRDAGVVSTNDGEAYGAKSRAEAHLAILAIYDRAIELAKADKR